METRVTETLFTFLERIERNKEQTAHSDIVFSDELRKEILLDGEDLSIEKEPILWPMVDKNMFYIVRTPPGVSVPSHAHSESIFRLLVSGSLTINDRLVDVPGTWFVVKAGTPYKIESSTGYVTLAGYGMACQTRSNLADGKHVVKATS